MKRESFSCYTKEEIESVSQDDVILHLMNKYPRKSLEAIFCFYEHRSFGEAGRFHAKIAIIDSREDKQLTILYN